MKLRRIGLRSIKTVIAVTFAFIIAGIFPNLSPAMMSAAAITAINISIFYSFRSSFDRIMSNITAILVAYLIQITGHVNPIGVALGMLVIVIVCNIFNWQYVIGNATIFFVFVLEVPYYAQKDFTAYAINRVFDTTIGTMLGLLINAYVFRPRQEKYLLATYRESYIQIRKSFKVLVSEDQSVDELKLIDSIAKINYYHKNLNNDVKLRMNENINAITVSKLNNLFRMAVSLIIELNDIEAHPKLSAKNDELLLHFFKGDFQHMHEVIETPKTEFDVRYNYEIKKLVHTLESIEYNIAEYTSRYEKLGGKWYMEGKKFDQ